MIAATQINKPTNWQDFEKLCKLLWGEIWNCEDSIKRHGRQGQNQQGVDVYAYVEKYGGYCGIQCKGKDDYTKSELTENEIDNEIKKALTFEPELKLGKRVIDKLAFPSSSFLKSFGFSLLS